MSKAGVAGSAGLAVGSSAIGCAAGVLSAGCATSFSTWGSSAVSSVGLALSPDSSCGWTAVISADTAPFPKNMKRAATATLAAPKLYLRIE